MDWIVAWVAWLFPLVEVAVVEGMGEMKIRFRNRNWYGERGWYGHLDNWVQIHTSLHELRMWLKHKLITKE